MWMDCHGWVQDKAESNSASRPNGQDDQLPELQIDTGLLSSSQVAQVTKCCAMHTHWSVSVSDTSPQPV